MAYSTPRTWVSGEYPTAAQFNANIRDNVSALANPPACKATRSTSQAVAHNTSVKINLNGTEEFDTATMHDLVTNNTRITVPIAGLYLITWRVNWASSGSAMIVNAKVNNTTDLNPVREDVSGTLVQVTTDTVKLAANDYIEGVAFQFSGSSINVDSATLSVVWLGLG